MSLRDFRKLIDVGAAGDYVGVIVEDPTAARPIRLELGADGYDDLQLRLDESEAGELFDALAQALREVVGGRASVKLHTDTPGGGIPVSDPSASIQHRG